jgi:hypothetical protein
VERLLEEAALKKFSASTRWFKYDRDKLWLVYTQSVPVIFEPPCTSVSSGNIISPIYPTHISFPTKHVT